jgi:hypothetical protein
VASLQPGILARGPWQADQVATRWREECFDPDPSSQRALMRDRRAARRGSPSHDGMAAPWPGSSPARAD